MKVFLQISKIRFEDSKIRILRLWMDFSPNFVQSFKLIEFWEIFEQLPQKKSKLWKKFTIFKNIQNWLTFFSQWNLQNQTIKLSISFLFQQQQKKNTFYTLKSLNFTVSFFQCSSIKNSQPKKIPQYFATQIQISKQKISFIDELNCLFLLTWPMTKQK